MRRPTNSSKVRELMKALGTRVTGPGRAYLTGGATAVLVGWRETTVDIDIKLAPEPPGAFEAIAKLKNELDVNIELASPDQFIPPVPGWEGRSQHIGTFGPVDFYHYDPIGQALAKIERGHSRDIADVEAMVDRGMVEPEALSRSYERIRDDLVRYPAIDVEAFDSKVRQFVDAVKRR